MNASKKSEHSGEPATNERIREAHSAMLFDWLGPDEEPHRVYKQGHSEECYICTLLNRLEDVRQRETQLREALIGLAVSVDPDDGPCFCTGVPIAAEPCEDYCLAARAVVADTSTPTRLLVGKHPKEPGAATVALDPDTSLKEEE